MKVVEIKDKKTLLHKTDNITGARKNVKCRKCSEYICSLYYGYN